MPASGFSRAPNSSSRSRLTAAPPLEPRPSIPSIPSPLLTAAVIRPKNSDEITAQPARLGLDVLEPIRFAQVGAPGRAFYRDVDSAEGVNQTAFFRLRAGPHTPLRDLVDLFRRRVSAFGHQA